MYQHDEEGLQSVAIDPNFMKRTNNWVDLDSEQQILDVPVDRGICCHVGGDIVFDAQGDLYLSTGDDTNPFASSGYAPIDER